MPVETAHGEGLAISDLLDRALNKGVVILGDATISLAGVDLIYVGLRVLVASADTAHRFAKHRPAGGGEIDARSG